MVCLSKHYMATINQALEVVCTVQFPFVWSSRSTPKTFLNITNVSRRIGLHSAYSPRPDNVPAMLAAASNVSGCLAPLICTKLP